MPQWLQWVLIAAGLLTIAFLLVFIRRQTRILAREKARREKAEAFQQQRRKSMIESIRLIALAVEEDQVEYSEACLRIKGLLDHVAPELLDQEPFGIFLEVHNKLQHMPTHRTRQATETRFVEKMDRERLAVEREHAKDIREAASAIRNYPFRE